MRELVYDSEMRDYRVIHMLPKERSVIESIERDTVGPAVCENDVIQRWSRALTA